MSASACASLAGRLQGLRVLRIQSELPPQRAVRLRTPQAPRRPCHPHQTAVADPAQSPRRLPTVVADLARGGRGPMISRAETFSTESPSRYSGRPRKLGGGAAAAGLRELAGALRGRWPGVSRAGVQKFYAGAGCGGLGRRASRGLNRARTCERSAPCTVAARRASSGTRSISNVVDRRVRGGRCVAGARVPLAARV